MEDHMSNAQRSVSFSVNLWGSHPDAGNDDCHTGREYVTREEAESALLALASHGVVPAEFARASATYHQDTAYVELCEEDKHGSETLVVLATPHAAKVERRQAREIEREEAEWKREQATQAGMAFGVEGYNDAMGY